MREVEVSSEEVDAGGFLMQVMLPTHLLLLFGLLLGQASMFNMPHPIDRFSSII